MSIVLFMCKKHNDMHTSNTHWHNNNNDNNNNNNNNKTTVIIIIDIIVNFRLCNFSSLHYWCNEGEQKKKYILSKRILKNLCIILKASMCCPYVCHTCVLCLSLCIHKHRHNEWCSLSMLALGEGDDWKRTARLCLRTVSGKVSHGDQECYPADPRGSPACHPWWVASPNHMVTLWCFPAFCSFWYLRHMTDSDWRIFFSPLDILALFVSVFGFIQMYYRTMIFEALNTLTDLPGTLTVEQIYQDRDKFASLVREVAAPDVGRMGIEILSFTIKV